VAIVLLVVVIVVNYFNFRPAPVFSVKNMLDSTWNKYTALYVEPSTGRVIDPARNNNTTSEGVSYTMLRAVWIDDKATFDKTFAWAQTNLKRPDNIYSWLYGQRNDGTFGILTSQSGENSASDADTNIALALIFAANRWNDSSYLPAARGIINGIWNQEVVTVRGVPYLAANNLEKKNPNKILINPSYLEPFAYRIFATIDLKHPWINLVGSSYDILDKSTAKLPPDWLTLDRKTGNIIPNGSATLSDNFSFDALRIPWNIALDYEWFREPRAKEYLGTLSSLSVNWNKNKKLVSSYTHDGQPASSTEIPAMYGGTVGYFSLTDPQAAQDIYYSKLISNYNEDANSWYTPLSYYDDNWAWFGIALYNHLLPNLALNPQNS
jgi:endoglucanase